MLDVSRPNSTPVTRVCLSPNVENLAMTSVTLMSAVSAWSRAAPARLTEMALSGVPAAGLPCTASVDTATWRP